MINNKKVYYSGWVDYKNRAYGKGIATLATNSAISYVGTFKHNRLHGVARSKKKRVA